MSDLELYVHIPFCVKKCSYCDFLSFAAGRDVQERYADSLIKEIQQAADRGNRRVSSVFFGGGTPSVLPGETIARIVGELRKKYIFDPDAEITIECNPGTVDAGKLDTYRQAGINRLSLGLQSADNRELKTLGRIHTWEEFLQSFQMARQAGFHNINVDLMSALPGQSVKSWEETLKKTADLGMEHISAYSLIIEEGTPFYDLYGADDAGRAKDDSKGALPSEEEEKRMYERTEEILLGYGYRRYEISNYAKEGFACRHNCGYWRRKDYLGFGLGASSLIEECRLKNTDDLTDYMERIKKKESCVAEKEELSRTEQIEEFMFLGLRLTSGVSEADFEKTFGETMEAIYGKVLARTEACGLLKWQQGKVFLTPYGRDISNYVLSEFLLK